MKRKSPESGLPPATDKPIEQYWLIKSEPETRLVNGVDVKFSIDDLKEHTTTSWEGIVRD
jgi:predicted RNA-binding protein with PUA-like domain